MISNFCLIGNIRHNFLVPRMIESAPKTFMPIQTQAFTTECPALDNLCMRCENKLETIFDQLYLHCNTEQGRTANKQGNPVLKTGLSCNRYRIFPVTGKNRDAYKVISLSWQYLPACSLFYPVWLCSVGLNTQTKIKILNRLSMCTLDL